MLNAHRLFVSASAVTLAAAALIGASGTAVAAVDTGAAWSSLSAGSSSMSLSVADLAARARAVVTSAYPINRFLVAVAVAPDAPVSTTSELGDWTFIFSAETDRPTTIFVTVDDHGHVSPMDIRYSPYGGAAPLNTADLRAFRSLTPDEAVDRLHAAGIDTKFKAIKFNRLLNGQNQGARYDFDSGTRTFASVDAATGEVWTY